MSEEKNVNLNPSEEPIFEGGPTRGQAEEWKQLYGNLFTTKFDDKIIIWRRISRQEFKAIQKTEKADQYYKEEKICEKCVLWPENYNFLSMGSDHAGKPTVLAEHILEMSGFMATEPEELEL